VKDKEYDDFKISEEEREQFIKHFEAGRYMKMLRGKRSLAELSRDLDVSTNYLSGVERGRLPSDRFISLAADYFGIDENDLFMRWGKVPILTRETVRNSQNLQRSLVQIANDKRLPDEKKDEFYDELYKTFERFLKKIEEEERIKLKREEE
jgi:transcriptional regulator with XRE-family HTH domain